MATVFLAHDLKHHRSVAIKILNADLSAALGAERFLLEIEIAARLQHPHILPLYDSGAAAGFLYYVMPYVEGESLRDRLQREKQLPLEEALRITGEVAGALAYAHSHGVVHRDIKPENIMLSGGTAVVADFGIARALSAAGEGRRLTQTGTVIGTPAYMSPEQATGSMESDSRSDQYSLACVVYEMLVGEPPFTGSSAQAVLARHSLDMVSPPSIVRANIPDAVEEAILRALAKVPADRYATTALFAEVLNTPSAATGAGRRASLAGARAHRPFWRRAVPAGALVLLVAAAVAGLLIRRRAAPRAGTEAELDARRVAVLYFEDLSPEKNLAYLADGLTEALIGELSRVAGLDVVSKNGVAPYRNSEIPRDSIGRALGAGTLVQGGVEHIGGRYRVSVRLVESGSGADFRRASFEQARGDLLKIRDTLAAKVADFLRERPGEEVRLREERAGTSNPAAWALVQQAEKAQKDAGAVVGPDPAAVSRLYARADSLLAAAEQIDGAWIEPVVLRARVDYQRSRAERDPRAIDRAFQAGLRHAEQAVQMNPQSPDALEIRGTLRFWRYARGLEPDVAAAERLLAAGREGFEDATRLNPRQVGAWTVLSRLYWDARDLLESNRAARTAYGADAFLP